MHKNKLAWRWLFINPSTINIVHCNTSKLETCASTIYWESLKDKNIKGFTVRPVTDKIKLFKFKIYSIDLVKHCSLVVKYIQFSHRIYERFSSNIFRNFRNFQKLQICFTLRCFLLVREFTTASSNSTPARHVTAA